MAFWSRFIETSSGFISYQMQVRFGVQVLCLASSTGTWECICECQLSFEYSFIISRCDFLFVLKGWSHQVTSGWMKQDFYCAVACQRLCVFRATLSCVTVYHSITYFILYLSLTSWEHCPNIFFRKQYGTQVQKVLSVPGIELQRAVRLSNCRNCILWCLESGIVPVSLRIFNV